MKEKITLDFNQSPLTLEEIKRIDQLDLSSLERHHLRLIAHCLGVFKDMESAGRALPTESDQFNWCKNNPALKNDPEFIELLIDQFRVVAQVLEKIASNDQVSPLDLTLDDLINHILAEKKLQH
tara:strand:+ start:1152 stop:1523 length:372 start_codon:yes stop_codon:yes gene_type:complete